MKILRVQHGNAQFYARQENEELVPVTGDIFGEYQYNSPIAFTPDIRILSPVVPPNIVAIGLNYRRHAQESGMKLPERPVIFLKGTNSVIGSGEDILLPAMAPDEVDYEGELTVVIGKTARNVSPENALEYVFGYTCGNDVSARDCQLRLDAQWARGKSFDTFCSVGPWIETDLNPDNLKIRTRVNGQLVQNSSTADLIFPVRELVSYCSKNMTLLPGTLLMTGTPEGVGFARKPPLFLRQGDTVEVEIEGIGILINRVKKSE